jgi:hypothetical protein
MTYFYNKKEINSSEEKDIEIKLEEFIKFIEMFFHSPKEKNYSA